MGIEDIRRRLGQPNLTMKYADGGRTEVLSHVDTLNEQQPKPIEKPMSVTGAAYLAGSLKDKIAAAKAKIEKVNSDVDAGVAKVNSAVDAASQVAASLSAEADELMASVGQFSNGSPA